MIDYSYSGIFEEDSLDKQLYIMFEGMAIRNENLFSESFTLDESLCSYSQLHFGSCEASSVKFKAGNIISSMKGKWFDAILATQESSSDPFQFGHYKVDSDKLTADKQWREVVAYDAMYDIINSDVSDWYNEILPDDDSSVTLKQFRDSFFQHFGITQKNVSLINDWVVIKKTLSISSDGGTGEESGGETALSGKDVITAICEINGCFGHINRRGRFEYVYLEPIDPGLLPAGDLYPGNNIYPLGTSANEIEPSHYINCTYEDYICKKIDRIQIRQQENDIGAIAGEGDNTYTIEGNFLVYGLSSLELRQIAENILYKVRGIYYRPFNCELKGNPCYEVGDAVHISTKYDAVDSYILKRSLKGIQSLRDTFSADGEEEISENVNSTNREIQQIKGKYNVLERTVEETRSEIHDIEAGTSSKIKQTASSILSIVSGQGYGWNDAGMTIEYRGRGIPENNIQATEERFGEKYLDEDSGMVWICTRRFLGEYFEYFWTMDEQLQWTGYPIDTEIAQLANEINISASQKVSEGDLISTINVRPEKIVLTSDRLEVYSTNFNLDGTGNVSMTGIVNAEVGGRVGNFNITNVGLAYVNRNNEVMSRIWELGVETTYLSPLEDEMWICGMPTYEEDPRPINLRYGFWGEAPCTSFHYGNFVMAHDYYIHSHDSNNPLDNGTPIFGLSGANNLHLGDFSKENMPNCIALNTKKVLGVNADDNYVSIMDNTSDARMKNILSEIDQTAAVDFIQSLNPVAYQYIAEAEPVTHWGFTAQDTIRAAEDSGMGESRLIERNPTCLDFPVNPEDDSTFFYSMKYDEMIAPITAALQYILSEIEKIKQGGQ